MKKMIHIAFIICISIIVLAYVDVDRSLSKADSSYTVSNIELNTTSVVSIDNVFGEYMKSVDENIYYSMCSVNGNTLRLIFGNRNTPMFNKAIDVINPCMAFATTWGEAGMSYKGISMTTVMDFNPNTYKEQIDWLNISRNLNQVGVEWYYANAKFDYNVNAEGHAYHMPNALLQIPRNGDRSTSEMESLGVGPYQVTSSDWSSYVLEDRVNPIYGFETSLKKVGTAWIDCDIDPISDLTVYAVLSLGHQGGNLITMDFGKQLINIMNKPDVQEAFLHAGRQMFIDLKELAYSKEVSLSDINMNPYLVMVESECGYDFSDYTGGAGITNKGNYVASHLLRYVFYKNYYTSGNNEYNPLFTDNRVVTTELTDKTNIAAQSSYVQGTHEHVAYKQTDFIKNINSSTTLAGAGCGWCSLTAAMAELNPVMCGGITPVDWISTEMKVVGEAYWTGDDGMYHGGPSKWIDTINNIGTYGTYEVIENQSASSTRCLQAIAEYAGDTDKVVLLSAAPGLFTSGGHIMVATDLSDDGRSFHLSDSSTYASSRLKQDWEIMSSFDFPLFDDNGDYVTGINNYSYAFKAYWVIQRKDIVITDNGNT